MAIARPSFHSEPDAVRTANQISDNPEKDRLKRPEVTRKLVTSGRLSLDTARVNDVVGAIIRSCVTNGVSYHFDFSRRSLLCLCKH